MLSSINVVAAVENRKANISSSLYDVLSLTDQRLFLPKKSRTNLFDPPARTLYDPALTSFYSYIEAFSGLNLGYIAVVEKEDISKT